MLAVLAIINHMNNIRKFRELRGLTLEALGDKIGKGLRTVQRYETGERNVSLKLLEKIAAALGVTTADLIENSSGKGAKKTSKGFSDAVGIFKNIERDPLLDQINNNVYFVWSHSELKKSVPIEKLPSIVYAIYTSYKRGSKKPKKDEIKNKAADMLSVVNELG